MPTDSELQRLVESEQAAEAVRAGVVRREAIRAAGVAWSGLSPEPAVRRDGEALLQAAGRRMAAGERWRASRHGRVLGALAAAERAVEALRAALGARLPLGDARCRAALADLEAATVAARAAVDETPTTA